MASIWTGISIPPAGALNGAGKSATERQLTVAAARRIVPLIYGEDRVGALLLNVLPHAFNTKMLVVQVLWAHAFDSISELKLNDQDLPAGSTVTHYRGDQLAQDPDMHFAMAAQGITYNVALTGFGYSVILIPTKSVGEQLNFTAKIRGRRVYDPRKDSTMPGGAGAHRLANPATWEWSDVPALALADWTASTVYGAGRPVDWSSVPAVANANDALVGGERRRVIGASITAATDVAVLAEALRAYAGCWAIPTASGVKFIPDADAASVDDLTHEDGDLTELGPLVIRDVSSAPTAVEVIFTDTSKVPWRDNSAIAELPGAGTTKPWRLSQVRMPGVQRYSQAMREAIERLNKLTLADLSTTARVADHGIRYQRGDIVRLSHPRGLTLKPMRVLDAAMLTLGQWQLDLQEHDPAVYNDSVQTQPSVPDTSLNNPAGPPDAPVGLALSVVPGALRIRRTRSTELDWAACEMVAGASPGTGAPVPADVGRDGADWLWPPTGWITVWARDVDSEGRRSSWVSASINVDSAVLLDAGNIDPPAGWLNSNVPLGQNLVRKATFDDAVVAEDLGGWAAAGTVNIVAWSVMGRTRAIAFGRRDTYEAGNNIEVRAGEVIYGQCDMTAFQSPYAVRFGLVFVNAAGVSFDWRAFGSMAPGAAWDTVNNPVSGQVVVPDGAAYGVPWLQIDGPPDEEFPSSWATNLYIGRAQKGATVGAPAGTSVAGQAAESLVADAATAKATATNAAANATSALSTLATMRSNGYIDAAEKTALIKEVLALRGEYSGILAQADVYGITTERAAYVAKKGALETYLGSLSPAWDNTTTDTPITPATDQTVWNDFYQARQTLLNKISDEAGKRAQWALVDGDGKPLDYAGLVIDLGNGGGYGQRQFDDPPSFYVTPGKYLQFKQSSSIGLPGGAEYWATLETTKQFYTGGGGGKTTQYAFSGTGTWRRTATSDAGGATWTAWAADLDRNNYSGALDATRNLVFRQSTDPGGAAVDGDIWHDTSTGGKSWVRVAGAWSPNVSSGSVGTGELGDEAATALRSATGGTVNLLALPSGTSTLVSVTYTAPTALTIRARLNGFIKHFSGYGHPGGSVAFQSFGKITTNSADVPGPSDTVLSYNASNIDPATLNAVAIERQFSMTAGQTLTFYALGYVGGIVNQPGVGGVYTPGAICEVAPCTLFLEAVKK